MNITRLIQLDKRFFYSVFFIIQIFLTIVTNCYFKHNKHPTCIISIASRYVHYIMVLNILFYQCIKIFTFNDYIVYKTGTDANTKHVSIRPCNQLRSLYIFLLLCISLICKRVRCQIGLTLILDYIYLLSISGIQHYKL